MKKILLFLAFAFAFVSSEFAQSSLKIFDASNNEVTNTTVQVYADTSYSYTGNFNIQNTTATALTVKARKEEIVMTAGAQSSICYAGACYSSAVYSTPCKSHPASGIDVLTADYTYPKTYGSSTIRYTVTNCANVADSATFVIVYNASPAGITNYERSYSISEPFPNPASSILNFNYKLGNNAKAHIVIHNLLGSLVKTVEISEAAGTLKLDIGDLDAGMYFYTLEVNNKAVAAKKFIVRR